MTDESDGVLSAMIGQKGAKAIIRSALRAGDVHILLAGPPASGKSVALTAIEESVPGGKYREAAGYTEVELRNTLSQDHPILLLDEIDAMKRNAYNALPVAMEQGVVTKDTDRESYDVEISTQIIAACNHPDDLPGHVEDRFRTVPFSEYSYQEFEDVCATLLTDVVEWVTDEDTARRIAQKVYEAIDSKSPRDARDAAKLARSADRIEPIATAMADADADVESDPLTPDEIANRGNQHTGEDTDMPSMKAWQEQACEHIKDKPLAYQSGRFLCPVCAEEYGVSTSTPLPDATG